MSYSATIIGSSAGDVDCVIHREPTEHRCEICNGTSAQWGWLNDRGKMLALVCRRCCEARGHFFWGRTKRQQVIVSRVVGKLEAAAR